MTKSSPKIGIDIREVYGLIDKMRTEIGGSIKSVDDKISRLDERFMTLESGRLTDLEKSFAEYRAELTPIKKTIDSGRLDNLERDLGEHKTELAPVKKIVYGMVTMILTAVVGALIFLVIHK